MAVATLFSVDALARAAATASLSTSAGTMSTPSRSPKIRSPGAMRDPFDFDRRAEVDNLSARTLVLRIDSATKRRKAERLDACCIPDEAIEHGASGAQIARPGRHQFPPQSIAKRASSCDVDLARAKIVQRLQHEPKRLAAKRAGRAGTLIEDVGLEDRHGAADDFHVRPKRSDGLRQKLPPPSQFVERIADNRGKQFVAQVGEQGIIVHLGHILLLGLVRT